MFDPKFFERIAEIFGYFPSADRILELLRQLDKIKLIILLYFVVFFLVRVIKSFSKKEFKATELINSGIQSIAGLFALFSLITNLIKSNHDWFLTASMVSSLAIIIVLISAFFKSEHKEVSMLQNSFLISVLAMVLGIFG
jgi:uncharacterized membrane protein